MAKVVAISGLGDEAPAPPSNTMLAAWVFVFGTTVGIFVGTLMLNPSRKKRS
jgi:hypothetical protein